VAGELLASQPSVTVTFGYIAVVHFIVFTLMMMMMMMMNE